MGKERRKGKAMEKIKRKGPGFKLLIMVGGIFLESGNKDKVSTHQSSVGSRNAGTRSP